MATTAQGTKKKTIKTSAKKAAKKAAAKKEPLGDKLTREAKAAARADAAHHGQVQTVERTGYNVTAQQVTVSVRVTMKDASHRDYEYRCGKNGENGKLW